MNGIDEILKTAMGYKASDIHLKVGDPPIVRVDGQLYPLKNFPRLDGPALKEMAQGIMGPLEKERFADFHEVDFAYGVSGLGRFRVNVYQQRGTPVMVLRSIAFDIPTFEDLNLPPVIARLAGETNRGMILVTGTTGCGKSTTLASMIDSINRTRSVNIITIEDPIEYLHHDRLSIVSQREVGFDTNSFSLALRSALRQDPDVILVGEMRDLETIEIALTAAETGHLVLSTLHTVDALETINRIVSVFPPYQQTQIRLQLAGILKGVVSQRLIPRKDGKGRVPAAEVLVSTARIRECIAEKGKTLEIRDAISTGHTIYGMQSFDQSLFNLFKRGMITYDEALRQTSNPDDFELKVKGISGSDSSWDEFGEETPAAEGDGGLKEDVERFGS
ncbi:MAG: type IV pilus twitching motility protein PilT [Deltaproteobacteria bacterium]|nr:type IV pilus twitching motility protein PilT [Candidatus Anaeroferrophillus wilburensis]MBN2888631.1 type IV pilus twitching motility protein PilT [Deltaproteobacteria bacterium]